MAQPVHDVEITIMSFEVGNDSLVQRLNMSGCIRGQEYKLDVAKVDRLWMTGCVV